jgi:hypothetical protein
MDPFITKRTELLKQSFTAGIRGMIGRTLEAIGFPARIREFEYVDPMTNQTIYLSTGARYSVLHVGDKQFFFERVSGRFDGTCTSLQLSVADRLEFSD